MKFPLFIAVIYVLKIQVFAQLRNENLGDVIAKDHRSAGAQSLPKNSKDQLQQQSPKFGELVHQQDTEYEHMKQQKFENADQQQAVPSSFKVENEMGQDSQDQQQKAEHIENKFVAHQNKLEVDNGAQTGHDQQQRQNGVELQQQTVQQRTDQLRQLTQPSKSAALEGNVVQQGDQQQRHSLVASQDHNSLHFNNYRIGQSEYGNYGYNARGNEFLESAFDNRFATAARIVSKVFRHNYQQQQFKQKQYVLGQTAGSRQGFDIAEPQQSCSGYIQMGQYEQRPQLANADLRQQRGQYSDESGRQTELDQYNKMGQDSQSFKQSMVDTNSRGMQRVKPEQQHKFEQDNHRAILGDLQQQKLEQDSNRVFQGENQQKLEQENRRAFQGDQEQKLEQGRTFQAEKQQKMGQESRVFKQQKLEQDNRPILGDQHEQKFEQDSSSRSLQAQQQKQHQKEGEQKQQQFEQQDSTKKQQEPSLALERARLEELRIKERARLAKLEAERKARLVEIQARERQAKLEAELRVRNAENRARQARLEAEARANQAILEAKVRQAENRARIGHGDGFADATEERQQQKMVEHLNKTDQPLNNTPQQLREKVAQPNVGGPVAAASAQ